MKKYVLMIPLILFPYAYLILFFLISMTSGIVDQWMDSQTSTNIWSVIVILYLLYILIITFYNLIVTVKGKYTAYEAAEINFLVKSLQVPAYIFHFAIGMMGTILSVWGIGIILLAVVVDLITITLTGINSIGCSIRMRKEKILTTPMAVLMGIGSFVYCADVGIAIAYFLLTRKKPNHQAAQSPKPTATISDSPNSLPDSSPTLP